MTVSPTAISSSVTDGLGALLACGPLGLPDLGTIWRIIKRIAELLAVGGVAVAAIASLVFFSAWVLSHLRKASSSTKRPFLSHIALMSSYVPVGATIVAAIGVFVPILTPFILKAFAFAVLSAAVTWCLAVAVLVLGGSSADLARARRALLLAGTPWYSLAAYLTRFL